MAHFSALTVSKTCRGEKANHSAANLIATRDLEDLHLTECVKRALHTAGYSVLRDIEVFVNARVVRLVGRVPTYFLKQIAQVKALATPGVHQIHNEVNVT